MRAIRRAAVLTIAAALFLALAAPAAAEEDPNDPYFYGGVNDGETVIGLAHGQAFFPYVVVHKGGLVVQCYLRFYTVRGPTWTLVRELPLGPQTPLYTYCGDTSSEIPFSYTWSDVDLDPGDYACKLAATDGTLWMPDDRWCGFTVKTKPDTTPPVTTNDYDGLWHSSAAATFIVWLTAEDDPAGWGMGAGQASIEISRDGGLTWRRWYTSRLGVGFPTRKRGTGSGVRTLLYRATDYAGNVEAIKSIDVLIDSRPPQTTDDAPHDPRAGDVTVHLTADDTWSGATAWSGVAETWYSVDGGRWTKGNEVVVPAARNAGVHWIAYYSVDNAGNVEYAKSCGVVIAAPGASASLVLSRAGRRAAR